MKAGTFFIHSAVRMLIALTAASHHIPASADFGRLFFSAEERRTLDAPPPPVAPPSAEAAPPPLSRQIDGILKRPDGRLTVWLAGVADWQQADADEFRLHRLLMLAPRAAPQLRLRIGDHWPPLQDADETALLPTVQVHPARTAAR